MFSNWDLATRGIYLKQIRQIAADELEPIYNRAGREFPNARTSAEVLSSFKLKIAHISWENLIKVEPLGLLHLFKELIRQKEFPFSAFLLHFLV